MPGREETFPKPRILSAMLPLDAPLKATAELDFAEALQPCIKEGKEADVAELTAALTSARKMVQWALDKDRSMVSVDELVSRVRAYASLLRGFKKPPGATTPPPAPDAAATPEKDAPENDAAPPPPYAEAAGADAAPPPPYAETAGTDAAPAPPPYEEVAAASSTSNNAASSSSSPPTLRHAVTYAWRDLLDTKGRDWAMSDSELEEASVLLAAAQALLSRAAREPLNDSNAVATFGALRRCGGLLAAARALVKAAEAAPDPSPPKKDAKDDKPKKSWFGGKKKDDEKKDAEAPEQPEQPEEKKEKKSWFGGSSKKDEEEAKEKASLDLRLALAEAWAALALAEAQHATIRKACAASHIEWSLIAALCVDQRDRYSKSIAGHIDSLTKDQETKSVKEWAGKRVCVAFLKTHVAFKSAYFEGVARYCTGCANLEKAVRDTDEDACGVALADLTEAARLHREAMSSASSFVAAAKPVCYVDSPLVAIDESAALVRRALDRAQQLNNGIFHKPVPELGPLPAPKSLVTAIPYEEPAPSHLWTKAAWDAIDPDKIDAKFGPASDARECCTIS